MCGEHASVHVERSRCRGSSPRVRGTPGVDDVGVAEAGIIPACAGNTKSPPCSTAISGSSPRVRGTLHGFRRFRLDPGIIPACAGNTEKIAHGVRNARDHPRVCGEHGGATRYTKHMEGSSPRVRGTLKILLLEHAQRGIIPACAGNTRIIKNRIVRGCGSSPRVRGTRHIVIVEHPRTGIIPACAGNTRTRRVQCPRGRDHPRVCGEHTVTRERADDTKGSSPRVRGTLFALLAVMLVFGIIPACAGNTSTTRARHCRPRDHPRVCGEHRVEISADIFGLGSSPRVRGTLLFPEIRHKIVGIIPACAGNTLRK